MDYKLLFFIIIIILLLGILSKLIETILKTNKKFLYSKNILITERELNFYKTLKPITDKLRLTIFIKVRVADLAKPKDNISNWQACFNKISQKHVDFTLCNNYDLKPIIVIELDDTSHDKENRIKRDIFVDDVMKQINIPIKHYRQFDKITLENDLNKILSNTRFY